MELTTKLKISATRKRLFNEGTLRNVLPTRERSPYWKGGRLFDRGYIRINVGTNSDRRYIYEHRIVMEKHLGRPLTDGEVVHHINGKKSDNRIENLMVLKREEHNNRFLVVCPSCSHQFIH